MPGAIVVKELCKRYGDTYAVEGASLDVEAGEFFGIIGPNGAGKTTTLEVIEGLRRADTGEVSVLGMAPYPRNLGLLRRIGVQMQVSSFFDRLTAREQIRTFAALYRAPRQTADDMLDAVGLSDKAGTRIEHLSGGQVQRLSIACALVHGPELVFLDEPTAGLDPQARRNLWDLLRDINRQGRTVVLTTHYMEEAETLCDRVAIMDAGQILQCGSPASLVRHYDGATRITVQGGGLTVEEVAQLFPESTSADDGESLVISTRDPMAVLTELAGHGAIRGLTIHSSTLEDVFLALTGREYRP